MNKKEAKPPRRIGKLISVKLLAKQKEAKGSDKSQIKNHAVREEVVY